MDINGLVFLWISIQVQRCPWGCKASARLHHFWMTMKPKTRGGGVTQCYSIPTFAKRASAAQIIAKQPHCHLLKSWGSYYMTCGRYHTSHYKVLRDYLAIVRYSELLLPSYCGMESNNTQQNRLMFCSMDSSSFLRNSRLIELVVCDVFMVLRGFCCSAKINIVFHNVRTGATRKMKTCKNIKYTQSTKGYHQQHIKGTQKQARFIQWVKKAWRKPLHERMNSWGTTECSNPVQVGGCLWAGACGWAGGRDLDTHASHHPSSSKLIPAINCNKIHIHIPQNQTKKNTGIANARTHRALEDIGDSTFSSSFNPSDQCCIT